MSAHQVLFADASQTRDVAGWGFKRPTWSLSKNKTDTPVGVHDNDDSPVDKVYDNDDPSDYKLKLTDQLTSQKAVAIVMSLPYLKTITIITDSDHQLTIEDTLAMDKYPGLSRLNIYTDDPKLVGDKAYLQENTAKLRYLRYDGRPFWVKKH